jgi:peptide/nickel transport system permease protein
MNESTDLKSPLPIEVLEETTSKQQRRYRLLHQLVTNPINLFSLIVIVTVLVCAIGAPVLSPYDPASQSLRLRLKPPIWQDGSEPDHLLGTDALGRDMLSRIIYGARISLIVGVTSVLIQGGIGVMLGLFAGYYGKWLDDLIMRLADIQQAIPFLILAVAVAAVLEASLINIIIILGLTGWVTYGRVVRGEVLSLRKREFVEAARALGSSDGRIIFNHIFPNVIGSVTVIGTLTVSRMILAEASLSFLGLGVPPPATSWGGMVADGRDYLVTAWWVSILPGLAIFFTVLAINLLGDWLREALDPTL